MRRFFWYIIPHTTFLAAISLFDMFVAFYFFRYGTRSFVAPLTFAAAGWAVVPVSQALAARLSSKISLPACLRIGALATAAAFATTAALAAAGVPWWALVPIGALYGSMRSIYWSARHQLDYHVSKTGRADTYFGWQAASTTGSITAVGVVGGFVVESFPKAGYTIVFGLAVALLVLTSFAVRNHSPAYGSFSTAKFRQITSLNPAFRRVFLASILRGASGFGTLPLAIQVFTFAALRRELPVAVLSGFGAVLALTFGAVAARSVEPSHRTRIAWASSLVLLGLAGLLAALPTGLLGSVYLVVGPIATVLLTMPTMAMDNSIFAHNDAALAEYTVAREVGLALGRLGSALPLALLFADPEAVGPYLALLSLAYPAQVLLLAGWRRPARRASL